MKPFLRKKNWLPMIIVAFAIIGLALYDSTPETLQSVDTPATEAPVVQFFITDLEATQFNQRGQLHYQFNAQRTEHWQVDPQSPSAEDYTATESPYFVFHRADDNPWHLQAQQGRSTRQNETIALEEDVRAWQVSANDELMAEILTDTLTLQPPQQFAHTDKPVIIRFPRALYRGVGMEADFQTQRFTLLANVKGSHEPPTRQ